MPMHWFPPDPKLSGFRYVWRIVTVIVVRIAVAGFYLISTGAVLAVMGIGLWTLFFGRWEVPSRAIKIISFIALGAPALALFVCTAICFFNAIGAAARAVLYGETWDVSS